MSATMKPNGQAPPPGMFEQFVASGKVWKLSHVNPGTRKRFAAWVEEQALLRLNESKARLKPGEYARRAHWLNEQIMAGAYDWGFPRDRNGRGSAVQLAMNEGEGPVVLAQMLLEEHHGEVAPEEIAAAWAASPDDFREKMARALDPNSASPSPPTTETGATPGPTPEPATTAA